MTIVTNFIDIEKLIDREVDDLQFEGGIIIGERPVIAKVDRFITFAAQCGYDTHVKLVFIREDGLYLYGYMHNKVMFSFKLMRHHQASYVEGGRKYQEYTYVKNIKVSSKEGMYAVTLQGFNQDLISDITTNEPCTKCGGTKLGSRVDGLCMPCIMSGVMKANVIKKELELPDGTILTGEARNRHIQHEKRMAKTQQEIDDGLRFKCASCKKYVLNRYKSKNNNVDICTKCAKYHARNKAEKDQTSAIFERRAIKKANDAMTCEDRAARSSSNDDMIAQFLAKKEK